MMGSPATVWVRAHTEEHTTTSGPGLSAIDLLFLTGVAGRGTYREIPSGRAEASAPVSRCDEWVLDALPSFPCHAAASDGARGSQRVRARPVGSVGSLARPSHFVPVHQHCHADPLSPPHVLSGEPLGPFAVALLDGIKDCRVLCDGFGCAPRERKCG